MCQEQTLDWPHPGFLIPSVKSAVSDRGQTLHLKTPDRAMTYLFRYLLKNAVMLSNGILSIRSYKSTCVASLTIRSSFG